MGKTFMKPRAGVRVPMKYRAAVAGARNEKKRREAPSTSSGQAAAAKLGGTSAP